MDTAQLEFLDGPRAGQRVPLDPAAALTIGRVKANGLPLPDSAVSRQHAKIFVQGGVHYLVDLNSSHGSFVNGQKVTRQALKEGDELRFGETRLRYGPASEVAGEADTDQAGADRDASDEAAARPQPRRAPPAPVPEDAPEDDDDGFQLEMPDELLPTAPAPVAPGRSHAPGKPAEDPFADDDAGHGDEDPAPQFQRAVADASTFGRPDAKPGGRASTVRSSAARSTGAAPLLQQDLDQHGGTFRWVAILAAVALTAGLGWGVMKLVSSAGGEGSEQMEEDQRPPRPSMPSAPSGRSGRSNR